MVRMSFVFLLLPTLLFSGEFTASVSQNQVALGESFVLNLTLKEASAKEMPSVDALKNTFSVSFQQQFYNTVIHNGKVSSNTTWKYTLIPEREGDAVIPSIRIDTSHGILFSEPITIKVIKGAAANSAFPNDMILTTDVDNVTPYKNEPFTYTVKIVSKINLANITMQKISLENAIVEAKGDPKIHNRVVDGVHVGVIEFDYLITPLKSGPLKIPSAKIQGVTPIKRKAPNGSFADDSFNLFSMMQGFDQLKPFELATEEVLLDVQPAIAGMDPWLPVKSLRIEETWNDSQSLQAGEPFTRGFTIIAEGIRSNQLPSLNDLQISDSHFKIYADKPELKDEEKDGRMRSYRTEQFTLIPQQSGTLTLPELAIEWWDVTKKEKAVARIPARTLKILPPPDSRLNNKMKSTVEEAAVSGGQNVIIQRDPFLYILIAGLGVLLCVTAGWGFVLQKKIRRLAKAPEELNSSNQREKSSHYSKPTRKTTANDKKEKLPDLNPT